MSAREASSRHSRGRRFGWRPLLACVLVAGTSLQTGAITPIGSGSAPNTMAARVQGCATCHGSAGQGTGDQSFPRIAGKPAGYIANQLANFRDGRRSYPPMNYLLEYLHDDYFHEMGAFFAAQHVPPAPPQQSALPASRLASAEKLVRTGDPHRALPACIACHGPRLTGMEPGIPGLLGLSSRYISAQIEAWRVGTRHANSPDCMARVATLLTESEITEVAAWLSSQATPASYAPAAQGTWKTALPCGSEP